MTSWPEITDQIRKLVEERDALARQSAYAEACIKLHRAWEACHSDPSAYRDAAVQNAAYFARERLREVEKSNHAPQCKRDTSAQASEADVALPESEPRRPGDGAGSSAVTPSPPTEDAKGRRPNSGQESKSVGVMSGAEQNAQAESSAPLAPVPCRCGGAVTVVMWASIVPIYYVWCECGALGPRESSECLAIAAWNRSHARPVTKAERDWMERRQRVFAPWYDCALADEIEARMANGAGSPSEGGESPHA